MRTPDAPFRVEETQRREVDQLIADGLLEPLLPGVVGPVGAGRDAAVRVAAVALALPARVRERGVVAQAAAAWVWCGGVPPGVVDVSVLPGRTLPRSPTLVGHGRRLPDVDVALLSAADGRLAVTTATRTLVDLLRLLPPPEALPAVAALAALPGVTAEGVEACLERMPRARGVSRARQLAAEVPLERSRSRVPSSQSIRLPVIR